jgi:hypothetical protein
MSLSIYIGDIEKECVELTSNYKIHENIYKKYGKVSVPYVCEYKNRDPDPERCAVITIDFEERNLSVSNGMYRFYPSFDEVNIFKYVTHHKGKAYYEKVIF